jgi:hypothetical protein
MFNAAFITALDALCAQHNVARTTRDGKITLIDSGGQEDAGKRSLRMCGHYYGLAEEDFGTVFLFRGTRYKLIGVKPNRPKYPLDCEHMGDGRVFKFHTNVVPQIVAQRAAKPAINIASTGQQQQSTPTVQPPANNNAGDGALDAFAQF